VPGRKWLGPSVQASCAGINRKRMPVSQGFRTLRHQYEEDTDVGGRNALGKKVLTH
jgi:hypothetical protein